MELQLAKIVDERTTKLTVNGKKYVVPYQLGFCFAKYYDPAANECKTCKLLAECKSHNNIRIHDAPAPRNSRKKNEARRTSSRPSGSNSESNSKAPKDKGSAKKQRNKKDSK